MSIQLDEQGHLEDKIRSLSIDVTTQQAQVEKLHHDVNLLYIIVQYYSITILPSKGRLLTAKDFVPLLRALSVSGVITSSQKDTLLTLTVHSS